MSRITQNKYGVNNQLNQMTSYNYPDPDSLINVANNAINEINGIIGKYENFHDRLDEILSTLNDVKILFEDSASSFKNGGYSLGFTTSDGDTISGLIGNVDEVIECINKIKENDQKDFDYMEEIKRTLRSRIQSAELLKSQTDLFYYY